MKTINPIHQRVMKLAWQRYYYKHSKRAKVNREAFSLYLKQVWDKVNWERKNPLMAITLYRY